MFIAGTIIRDYFKTTSLTLGEALVSAALAWLLIPLIAIVPFVKYFMSLEFYQNMGAYALPQAILDSYFETISGYTSTGLTMVTLPEKAPHAILIWRSLIQWFGGVGVIVLFLAVLMNPGTIATRLYIAEGRTDRLVPSITETARIIWRIYFLYTAIGILLLYLAGMPLFDAINHGLTGIATAGFSTKTTSIGYYKNLKIEIAMIPIMFAGAISFAIHKKLLAGKISSLYKNVEFRYMLGLFLIATLLITFDQRTWQNLSRKAVTNNTIFENLRYSAFQTVSAITTTGFGTTDLSKWSDFSKFILIVLMIIGGCFGSTAGAIKLIRFVIMYKATIWIVKKYFFPVNTVMPFKVGNRILDEKDIMNAALFAFLYISVLVFCSLVFMFYGQPTIDAIFEVASALGGVGLSVGVTAPTMPNVEKIVLIIAMYLGRLEIFPFIALISFSWGKTIK